jgi:hypothetical protein
VSLPLSMRRASDSVAELLPKLCSRRCDVPRD